MGDHMTNSENSSAWDRSQRRAKWQLAGFGVLFCVVVVGVYWAIADSTHRDIHNAEVGDCITGGSTLPRIVSCSDKDASNRVSAVLDAGRSEDCPGPFSLYRESGGKTICLDLNPANQPK